jgi:hypothetical protein
MTAVFGIVSPEKYLLAILERPISKTLPNGTLQREGVKKPEFVAVKIGTLTVYLPKSAKANAVIFGILGGIVLIVIGLLFNHFWIELVGGASIVMAFYIALPEKIQRSVWKEVKWYMRDLWER